MDTQDLELHVSAPNVAETGATEESNNDLNMSIDVAPSDAIPQSQSISGWDSNSDTDAVEVEMQAISDNDFDSSYDMPGLISAVPDFYSSSSESHPESIASVSTSTSTPRSGVRRARVEDDEDEERDRRHPSQRIGSNSSPQSRAGSTSHSPSSRVSPPAPVRPVQSASSSPLASQSNSNAPRGPLPTPPYNINVSNGNSTSTNSNSNPDNQSNNNNPNAGPYRFFQHFMSQSNPNRPPSQPGQPNYLGGVTIRVDLNAPGAQDNIVFPPLAPNFSQQPNAPQEPRSSQGRPQHQHASPHPQPNPPLHQNQPQPDVRSFADLLSRLGIFNALLQNVSVPETPDPDRARRLIAGLEEVPTGLVRRLERVGTSTSDEGGCSGGDGGCAVCWEKLLPEDERADAKEESKGEKKVDDKEKNDELELPVIVTLPCAHVFHSACLLPWFSRPKQTTCPTCRFNIDPENLTYISWRQRQEQQRQTDRPAQPSVNDDANQQSQAQTPMAEPQQPLPPLQDGAPPTGPHVLPSIQSVLGQIPIIVGAVPINMPRGPRPMGTPQGDRIPAGMNFGPYPPRPMPPGAIPTPRPNSNSNLPHNQPPPSSPQPNQQNQPNNNPNQQPSFVTIGFDVFIGSPTGENGGAETFSNGMPGFYNMMNVNGGAPGPNAPPQGNNQPSGEPGPQVRQPDAEMMNDMIILADMQDDDDENVPMPDAEEMREFERMLMRAAGVEGDGAFNPNPNANGNMNQNPNPNPNQNANAPPPSQTGPRFQAAGPGATPAGNGPPRPSNPVPFSFALGSAALPGLNLGNGFHFSMGSGGVGGAFAQMFSPPPPSGPRSPVIPNGNPRAGTGSPPAPNANPATTPSVNNFPLQMNTAPVGWAFAQRFGPPPRGGPRAPGTPIGNPRAGTVPPPTPNARPTNSPTPASGFPPQMNTYPLPPPFVLPPGFSAGNGTQIIMGSDQMGAAFARMFDPSGAGAQRAGGASAAAGDANPGNVPAGARFGQGNGNGAATAAANFMNWAFDDTPFFTSGPPAPAREKRPWTPPPAPGPTLRQRIEQRERDAGLRCCDMSCGLGPSDEDPFVSMTTEDMRQLTIRGRKDGEGECLPVCGHTFHSACLVSAERVALRGEDAPIVGDEVEVSCPVCRGVGLVSKIEWDEGVSSLV